MKGEAHPPEVIFKMEEATCYCNFRPREKQQRLKNEFQLQDILLRHPQWLRCLLQSGCVTILLLVGATIALGVLVWQTQEALDALKKTPGFQGPSNSGENDKEIQHHSQDDCQDLLQHLCKSYDHHPSESSRCKLCPENWLRHEDKCYWISKGKQAWNESQDDCKAKISHLAIIQNREELDFIQHITDGAQLLWIGLRTILHMNKWSWVDGSLLNGTLLQVGTAQANSCGMLKGNKVISETCNAIRKWVCEKEALLV